MKKQQGTKDTARQYFFQTFLGEDRPRHLILTHFILRVHHGLRILRKRFSHFLQDNLDHPVIIEVPQHFDSFKAGHVQIWNKQKIADFCINQTSLFGNEKNGLLILLVIKNRYKQQQLAGTTMRLDPSYLHFITKEELRILVAIEIAMKNHQYVPLPLINSIGNLRSGETYRTISKLLKNKLIVHIGGRCDGYKLTYLGYDYLALHTFLKRGVLKDVICKIGVGKQSDIYMCEAPDGSHVVLKLTRLGRRSFKTIKNNREYLNGRNNYNWLYLSRLSSIREFTFMQILHEDGLPTPKPIDTNRHAILMSLIDGDPLCHIKKFGEHCSVKSVFEDSLNLAKKFAARGLIHGDFNEFNLMISATGVLTVIDFPQCISTKHINAEDYFNRDIECLYVFFDKLLKKSHRQGEEGEIVLHQNDINFEVSSIQMPLLSEIVVQKRLDLMVSGRGHFKLSEEKHLQDFMKEWNEIRNQELKEGGHYEIDEDEQDDDQEAEVEMEEGEELEKKQEKLEIEGEDIKQIQAQRQEEGDEDLNQLMAELKNLKDQTDQKQNQTQVEAKVEVEEAQEQSEGQNDQSEGGFEMREEWKGLTAYQIRQKLKEERRLEREKKKEEMSTNEYIKRALQQNKKKTREIISRGNYGAKKKAVNNSQQIKDGLQMGW